jgi:hypothetical protein
MAKRQFKVPKGYKLVKASNAAVDIGEYWTRKGFEVTKADAGQYLASNGKSYPVVEATHKTTGQKLALKATRNGSVYVARNF